MTVRVPPPYPRMRVAAIVRRGDSLLLVQHRKGDASYWLLPGGGVEFGESLAEALTREVWEETGLEVRPGQVVLVSDSIPSDLHRHIVHLCFTAEEVGGNLHAKPDHRVVDAAFVSLDDLPTLTLYPDMAKPLLEAIRSGFARSAAYLGNSWT